MEGDDELREILKTAGERGELPSEDLLPLVYDELRRLAATRMKGEAEGHTLQATALVHEAWIRLSARGAQTWNDRAHFFRAAALEMRRLLVRNARSKSATKRGREFQRIDLEEVEIADAQPDERILLIDEALKRLDADDPHSARIVTLKFFGGLTNKEVAEMEGVTERTIERQWAIARMLLLEIIENES